MQKEKISQIWTNTVDSCRWPLTIFKKREWDVLADTIGCRSGYRGSGVAADSAFDKLHGFRSSRYLDIYNLRDYWTNRPSNSKQHQWFKKLFKVEL